ncbi:MAG: N-acetylmuramic acid 6-phosphate etherase [Oscillospiraceae bacterium]|nr:N-acetylmuramic acid 6-phosphate etherase [Oscillospiraceae bacterium]
MSGITGGIPTEGRRAASADIDKAGTLEMLRIINGRDKEIAFAVEKTLGQVALAVESGERAIRAGGRVVYCGAGTSGRLGVLDASECPPTYGVPPEMFTGLIAGGIGALLKSAEGAEDDPELGKSDLMGINFCADDFLVGIAASGRTPYVIGAMMYAKGLGAPVAAVTCHGGSEMAKLADISIAPDTGPEVITGSTRMGAGTAQKMVLNMVSTGIMIKMGKVYGNLMVDLRPTNKKLEDRARRIICGAAGCDYRRAGELLELAGMNPKTAIVMEKTGLDRENAQRLLDSSGGRIAGTCGER